MILLMHDIVVFNVKMFYTSRQLLNYLNKVVFHSHVHVMCLDLERSSNVGLWIKPRSYGVINFDGFM